MSHSSSGRYAQPYGNITVNGQRVGLPPANQFLHRNNFGDINIAPNGRVEVGGPGGIRVEPSGHIYFNGILTVVPYPPYVIHQGPPPVAPHPMGPKTTVVPKRRSVLGDAKNKANVQAEKSKSHEKDNNSDLGSKNTTSNDSQRPNSVSASVPMSNTVQKELPMGKESHGFRPAGDNLGSMFPVQAAGSKRKSNDFVAQEIDLDDIDCEGMYMDLNCDQVRRRIRTYLDSGEMKVGEFCSAIGVSNKSLNDFLRQSGKMKGSGSSTYGGAWEFFKKREIAGLKMPKKKQKTVPNNTSSNNATSNSAKEPAASTSVDISSIQLPNQFSDNVPVFDTCDEIRRKISAHLVKPRVTKAQFCRDLRAQLFSASAPANIQSAQLDRFRSNKGPRAGCTSSVYYSAYVFFEKWRIAEGKAKSKHRTEMESIWPGGMERDRDASQGYWCLGSERPHEDSFGRVGFY